MGVDVIVPAFGPPEYRRWALTRSLPSIERQTVAPDSVIVVDDAAGIVEARNKGAARGEAEWLLFVDADDEISETYVSAMLGGTCDLRGPATTFIKRGGTVVEGPLLVPARDLEDSNYLVIGTMLPRVLFEQVGGFRSWPVHEDYDLWLRCARAGASIEQIEEAVYTVHERPGSRNRKPLSYKRRIDDQIRASR